MTLTSVTCRPHRTFAAAAALTVFWANIGLTGAQEPQPQPQLPPQETVRVKIRPHCEKLNPSECAQYAVKDPVTVETPVLVPGSILDMDILIENQKFLPIRRARAWLSYDPSILEGKKVEIGRRFPVVTPGEADFNTTQGFVQVGVSTEGATDVKDPFIPVARIQFLVKAVPEGGKTVISYYDVLPGLQGHTLVTRTDPSGQGEQNVLHPGVGSLVIRIEAPTAQASSAAASTAAISSAAASQLAVLPGTTSTEAASSVVSAATPSSVTSAAASSAASTAIDLERSSFVLLQVQNLRITTEGSTVYLAWEPLPSSELQGYNVYYGAESGRYVQRRSLPKESNTLAIRALPLDTTYYVAVRAVNAQSEESAFSQEVAVKVGNPATSTSPLAQIIDDGGPQGRNPVDGQRPPTGTPGATGLSSTLLLLILASAIIGTLFAFRRQLAVSAFHK
ncbi:fibronectin type III domain-containing protein [Candidatus Peregrinibacteria bacterium]|nr:fibronectin type III domain-containing protein [Candidatus Peregrinibacteria bacterium]